MFKLINDWRAVLRYALSIRYIVAAFLFTVAEVALPLLDGYLPIPRGLFAGMSALSSAGAFVFRLKAQKEFQ